MGPQRIWKTFSGFAPNLQIHLKRPCRAKRAEFKKLWQELGEGQEIVGHVEKVEEAEAQEPVAQEQEIEIVQVEEDVTAEAETVETTGQRRKT